MKVFIAYGWPEGQWHGKQLRNDLIDCNYQITYSPEEADIIIAHSAGCYLLPNSLRAKLILLIGLPNWPNKPLIKCTSEKVSLEIKNRQWFQKTAWHIFYAVTQPIRLYDAYKTNKRKYLPRYSDNKVVLVHNQEDTYMNEAVTQELAKQKGWSYEKLNGQHDDLWQNTKHYTNLIRNYLA